MSCPDFDLGFFASQLNPPNHSNSVSVTQGYSDIFVSCLILPCIGTDLGTILYQ